MATMQTVDGTTETTGLSTIDAYVRVNGSEKQDYSALIAKLVPVEDLSWRDILKITDAAERHIVAAGEHATVGNISNYPSNVLCHCTPAGTNLGQSPSALWRAGSIESLNLARVGVGLSHALIFAQKSAVMSLES